MSNVLIGIIGVILFIGLALAGALFLGPRFQESTNNSKASAIIQRIAQTASAANLYEVQEGAPIAPDTAGITTLVSRGYMKSPPPTDDTVNRIIPINASGGVTGSPSFVIADLAGSNARAVCEAIERQSGGSAADVGATPTEWPNKTRRQQGCYYNGPTTGGAYLAYVKI
jgi:hypothetical protein